MTPQIIFCLPGRNFSGEFLDSWTNLLGYCFGKGYQIGCSRKYDPVVYYARNKCLGGDVRRGPDQKPFNGDLNYTHMMWIDSDMVFSPNQIERLLGHDKDIVAGLYKTQGNISFAAVEHWDEQVFQKEGSFEFMTEQSLAGRQELIEVSYTGFGFVLIKRGVFESLSYPWFRPIFHRIGETEDFSSEDVSFCLMVKEKGFKIWIDPTVRVGHQKPQILL